RLADALAAKLRDFGGVIRTSSPVDSLPRADLVLADVVPRELLRLARGRLPERYARALHSYRHGPGAFKLDWALDGPIPGSAAECRRAGTVHLGGSLDEISASEWGAWRGRLAARPFVLLAQPSLFDPTRATAGQQRARGRRRGNDRANRGAGRALCTGLPRARARPAHDGPCGARGAQPESRRRRSQCGCDGPRAAALPARAKARPLSDAARGRLSLLGRYAPGWGRPRDVRLLRRAGRAERSRPDLTGKFR